MQKQSTIEQRIDRLRMTLETHRRQIHCLGPQDFELLSILQAERQMILTEIDALNWVLEDSREDTPLEGRNCPHSLPIGVGIWSSDDSAMSQAGVSRSDAPATGRPQMVF
jgi:hypothetical protein